MGEELRGQTNRGIQAMCYEDNTPQPWWLTGLEVLAFVCLLLGLLTLAIFVAVPAMALWCLIRRWLKWRRDKPPVRHQLAHLFRLNRCRSQSVLIGDYVVVGHRCVLCGRLYRGYEVRAGTNNTKRSGYNNGDQQSTAV